MAIDRSALIQPFGLNGWRAASWIVPPQQFATRPYLDDRWAGASIDDRRRVAAGRIAQWTSQSGKPAVVRVSLPRGPGSELLLRQLAGAWAPIGVGIKQVPLGERADLELRDTLARYPSARWFLNQFNCRLKASLCSPEADALVRQSLMERDATARELLLIDAHAALTAREAFIPLGAPVRWSLVRGSIRNYLPNPWGLHPLFPLSQPTT